MSIISCLITFSHYLPLTSLSTLIQALLEDKNDQHGRNSTLLSYVSYQSTLPHPDDSPPTPVGPQHPQHPPPPSSVPTHRKYSRCVWEKEVVSRWVSDCVLAKKWMWEKVQERMSLCVRVFVSEWEKMCEGVIEESLKYAEFCRFEYDNYGTTLVRLGLILWACQNQTCTSQLYN